MFRCALAGTMQSEKILETAEARKTQRKQIFPALIPATGLVPGPQFQFPLLHCVFRVSAVYSRLKFTRIARARKYLLRPKTSLLLSALLSGNGQGQHSISRPITDDPTGRRSDGPTAPGWDLGR